MTKRYFLVNKPFGYLTQFSGQDSELTLAHLIQENQLTDFPKDVYSVGRLDKDSEGILLLTNDNQLKTKLLDPKHHYKKTYWVQVEGSPSEMDLNKIRQGGIEIKHEGKTHRCLPANCHILPNVHLWERNPPIRVRKNIPASWIEIQLVEGKNRQIRKMTAAIGYPTLRLVRIGIGNCKINDNIHLNVGEIIEISKNQIHLF